MKSFANIAGKLAEMGYRAEKRTERVGGIGHSFIKRGSVITAQDAKEANRQGSAEESLLERFWMINSIFPERAFSLQVKGYERETGLFFLQIEKSGVGVYLKAQSFLDAWQQENFDELRVQLPDAPVLVMKDGAIKAMITSAEPLGNFVEAAEALRHGRWEVFRSEQPKREARRAAARAK